MKLKQPTWGHVIIATLIGAALAGVGEWLLLNHIFPWAR